MATDFILTRLSIDHILECEEDPEYGRRSRAYMGLLGIGDAAQIAAKSGGNLSREAYADLQARGSAALGDRSEERARAIVDAMSRAMLWEGDNDATMDLVTAEWLRKEGLSAPELYMLTSFAEEMYIERKVGEGEKREVMITSELRETPTLVVVYDFEKYSWWSDGRLDLAERMTQPATVRAAAIGRPLQDVFQHPFLNGHDVRIVDWSDPTIIITDAPRVRIFPE